jgi:myo-inositol-1(or 4)-monophosphatase
MTKDKYLKTALDAARKAGDLLNRRRGEQGNISYKGTVDLVTDADRESQQVIADHIQREFPDHNILSEEELSRDKGSDFRWLIDPLDGTTNYAHDFPVFCISLALEFKNEIITGLVFDPVRNEMFTAVRGEGAELNGNPIFVSRETKIDRSLLATGFPYDIRESEINNLDHFSRMAKKAQAIRRCGSAALDLCFTACGRFDGFWEMKLAPWDMAAGSLILTEAGGKITDFGGGLFRLNSPEILASNGRIHKQMADILIKGRREMP